jgi:hypothetical protein
MKLGVSILAVTSPSFLYCTSELHAVNNTDVTASVTSKAEALLASLNSVS